MRAHVRVRVRVIVCECVCVCPGGVGAVSESSTVGNTSSKSSFPSAC